MDEAVYRMIEDFKQKNPHPSVREQSVLELSKNLDIIKENISSETDNATLRLYYKELLEKIIEENVDYANDYTLITPYFTKEESANLKDYYAKSSGEETWDMYFGESMSAILSDSNNSKAWVDRITGLQNKMKIETDPDIIDQTKQAMVDIGWNPEVEYNSTTAEMARQRYLSLESYIDVEMIDIEQDIENFDENQFIQEASNQVVFPVSICLVKGKTIFSKMITQFTKSEYSHAAIALNGDFKRVYSFNLENKENKFGGFSIENISEYPHNNKLAIFTFFIKAEDFKKLKTRIDNYVNNIKNTIYSVANILTYPIKAIKINAPTAMICSQFVDSCLKFIDIDITGDDSSNVSPAMLYNKSIDNVKIYKTYDGKVKDFKINKTANYLKSMSSKATLIKEFYIMNEKNFMSEYLPPVRRKSIKPSEDIDFEAEYNSYHKLLIECEKHKDYETMKDLLARLYYINYVLQRDLYSNKQLKNKVKNSKLRTKVLSDFNKYIKILRQVDRKFNFQNYYTKTLYADTNYSIIPKKNTNIYNI